MDNFDCIGDYRMNSDMSCCDNGCRERSMLPCNPALAMAYIPFQQWNDVYCAEKALSAGTVFPCLNLPFVGCSR